jgi:hypothetical protein
MRLDERARAAAVDWLVLVVAVALPCWQLTALDRDYHFDWSNHQWAISYTAAFFRQHWTMPGAFHTVEIAGLAVPVFYGSLFTPVMGVLARVTSPELAIRIAVVALYAAQFRLVSKALGRVGAPRSVALGVACLVIWAIYPLTNLYNRGALPEWFATGLLVCALALLVLLCRADDTRQRRRHACALILALTLAAGTHPITALLGVPMFVALGAAFWWLLRADRARIRAIARAIAPWLGLAAICIAPWLYATLGYAGDLAIRRFVPDVVFFPDSIDAWSTRFSPLPLDPRVAPGVPLTSVSSPYLDAQVNLALLIAFAALAVVAIRAARGSTARRPLAVVLATTIALFGVFTAMSLVPATYAVAPGLGRLIQFAYRAITYENLALLAGVFLIAMAAPPFAAQLGRPVVRAVLAACLALSAAGVAVKWEHIAAAQQPRAAGDPIHLPAQYYGAGDYATEARFAPLDGEPAVARSFAVDGDRRFGLPGSLVVELAEPTWIATNVQSFAWNAIAIDGGRVAAADLRTANRLLVVRVPAGRHVLTTRFAPPAVWRVLRVAALLGLVGWWIALGVALVGARRTTPGGDLV